MTRTATQPYRKKRMHDATPWEELKEGFEQPVARKEKKESPGMVNGKPVVTSKKPEGQRVRKAEFRRVKRLESRHSGKACYNCRETSHTLANCPKIIESHEQTTDMCYKCGSLEHKHKECKKKMGYKNATCFVCNQSGHISRDCPDNPNGLYPHGGSCLECGSVRHFMRDCPDRQRNKGIYNMKLSTTWSGSADVECTEDPGDEESKPSVEETTSVKKTKTNKKKKVIKF